MMSEGEDEGGPFTTGNAECCVTSTCDRSARPDRIHLHLKKQTTHTHTHTRVHLRQSVGRRSHVSRKEGRLKEASRCEFQPAS